MEGTGKLEGGGKVRFHFEYIQVLKCITLLSYGLRGVKKRRNFCNNFRFVTSYIFRRVLF